MRIKKVFSTNFDEQAVHVPLLVIRLLAGGFMLTHGIPKLMRLFSGDEIRFADPYGLGAFISFVLVIFAEFFCSIFTILGLGTRLAAVPIMITMLTAAFYAHADDPFGTKEKPLVFFIVFFTLFVFGSGRYSVDQLIFKKLSP
jgi:putative oxidoreductase